MRIIPVQEMKIENQEYICIDTHAYTQRQLAEILQTELKEPVEEEHKLYTDKNFLVNKEGLIKFVPSEYEEIIKKFPDTQVFAITQCRGSKWAEIYYLKIALSIVYIANRWKEERYNNFFRQVLNQQSYFNKDSIVTTLWDVKLGDRKADSNDLEITIPSHYTIDDIEDSHRMVYWRTNVLRIKEDINEEVNNLCIAIIRNTSIADKLKSAFNLLYTTFSMTNLDLVIPTYATILETLLLGKDEDNQRKKVAVRSACLIADGEVLGKKRYIANWVYDFYSYRNMIVHDGKSHVYIRLENGVVFTNAVNIVHHMIYFLIKIYTSQKISEISEIKSIVTKNKVADGMNNAFDYIDEKLCMYYEEE